MNRKCIGFLVVLLTAAPSFAQTVQRTDPVNAAKLSAGFKVQVPEGLGFSVGIDAPVTQYLALGGEASMAFTLPVRSESLRTILRLNVAAKPRLVYNDRFETYVKAMIGPAFLFTNSGNSLGVDVAVLPGFQFSMTESVGMFSEIGYGLSYFPRAQETVHTGIFRTGVFFSF